MPISRRLGSLTVTALEDAAGPFFTPRREAFPTATEAQWMAVDAFDPEAVTADGRWWLRFRAFAIVDGYGRTTIVDTGVGPRDPAVDAWTPVPGRLPAELAAAGIDPGAVETVVLTHLHTDHTGWAVVPGDVPAAGRRPFFPNARYVIQRADAAELPPSQDERLLLPLRDSGRLHLVDGDHRLSHEITTVHTPGHTPGHQSVLLSHGPDELLLTGDLLVHAIQLLFPELPYAHEDDPGLARETRERMLERIRRRDGVLGTSHLTNPFQ